MSYRQKKKITKMMGGWENECWTENPPRTRLRISGLNCLARCVIASDTHKREREREGRKGRHESRILNEQRERWGGKVQAKKMACTLEFHQVHLAASTRRRWRRRGRISRLWQRGLSFSFWHAAAERRGGGRGRPSSKKIDLAEEEEGAIIRGFTKKGDAKRRWRRRPKTRCWTRDPVFLPSYPSARCISVLRQRNAATKSSSRVGITKKREEVTIYVPYLEILLGQGKQSAFISPV